MTKFLLDTNISPETRQFLTEIFAFDVIDLITEKKPYLSDEQIVRFAKKEKRVIIQKTILFYSDESPPRQTRLEPRQTWSTGR